MYLLGFDIGSSSVKAALMDARSGKTLAVAQSPDGAMPIATPQPDWAEQHPEMWWNHACLATRKLLADTGIPPSDIKGIGIAYQMHGLVCVDKDQNVLRPAIIWCDSRAVEIGDRAYREIGPEKCQKHLLNSPGNFTASKLKWVKDHEPQVYSRIDQIMLPGDYIALKLTGKVQTTPGGLSEGMLWDFVDDGPAGFVMDHFGFDHSLIPEIVPAIGMQSVVTDHAARETGLDPGTPVCYRAGDQPNNAMTLDVLNPGEIAGTGGTSGVIYGITDKPAGDPLSRVNCFAHVNHSADAPRIGILLCINGAGILYNWLREQVALQGMSFQEMEAAAAQVAVGSEGLVILPFGNGAERMLGNRNPGAQLVNLQLNRHRRPHLYRAALEGIAFAFAYGVRIQQEMGLDIATLRVGNDNLFRSGIFSAAIAHLLDTRIEVMETTGAAGAAKAAGVGGGMYATIEEAMQGNHVGRIYEPSGSRKPYREAYETWERHLQEVLSHY